LFPWLIVVPLSSQEPQTRVGTGNDQSLEAQLMVEDLSGKNIFNSQLIYLFLLVLNEKLQLQKRRLRRRRPTTR